MAEAGTPLPVRPMPRQENIVRLAVSTDAKENLLPALFYFDQSKALPEIIQELCKNWQLPNAETFALKSEDFSLYITEKNRQELKDGAVLKLTLSPAAQVSKFLQQMASATVASDRSQALRMLRAEVKDITYANQFVKQNGLDLLMRIIGDIHTSGQLESATLKWALCAYSELLAHDIVAYDSIPSSFVTKVISLIASGTSRTDPDECSTVSSALRVAGLYVKHNKAGFHLVRGALPFQALTSHAESPIPIFKERALALINNLIKNSPSELDTMELFTNLEGNGINAALSSVIYLENTPAPSFAHELYLYQCFSLNRLDARRQYLYNPQDPDCAQYLRTLRQALPEIEEDNMPGRPRRAATAMEPTEAWRRLGFTDVDAPEKDFAAPPGVLALEMMAQFANQDHQGFSNAILGQMSRAEEYFFPFVRMAVAVTNLLLSLLRVGEEPSSTGLDYLPMFYAAQGKAFMQVFCACMVVATKTWQSMDAKQVDFDKVVLVLRKQLTSVLSLPPEKQPRNALEEFKALVLNQYSYADIERMDLERLHAREEKLKSAEPVQRLRNSLREHISTLVREQRVACMCQGDFFVPPAKAKKKDARFFCMLAPNKKTLHWSDALSAEDPAPSSLAALKNNCVVADIKVFSYGADVPSVAKLKKLEPEAVRMCFAILPDGAEEYVEFMASSPRQLSVWLDGLRTLLNKDGEEDETRADIERLLKLNLSLRLLDLYDADLPSVAPVVPPLPTNVNFIYSSLSDQSVV